MNKKKLKLKKELGIFSVFAIATGTTLSSGFFLLPGLAAQQGQTAIVIAYLIAILPLIPAIFSIIELSTAMPKAGGVYYFLDRTMGPVMGTIGGLGTWLSLIMKVSFALVGMSAYLKFFLPTVNPKPIAIIIAVILSFVNLFGSKKSGSLQILMVFILLGIVGIFIGGGLPKTDFSFISTIFKVKPDNIIATAGLVYVSYIGITKVASLSEEIQNPGRNLPLGIFLSLIVTLFIYIVGISIMLGVLPLEELMNSLTPAALAADKIAGRTGAIVISVAALLSFVSVANSGILSASRYPLAMSRDQIFPNFFGKLNKFSVPHLSLFFSLFIILSIIIFLNPMQIAKLAGSFQLMVFALVCLATIVMRESGLEAYDPTFKSPLYPYMQIIGIFSPFILIIKMGWLPAFFALFLGIFSILWYKHFAKDKINRNGAIFHIFQRLGEHKYDGLESELRSILKDKDPVEEDNLEKIIANAQIIDIKGKGKFTKSIKQLSVDVSKYIDIKSEELYTTIIEETKIGATPVSKGIALPHYRTDKVVKPILIIMRCKKGMEIDVENPQHKNDFLDMTVYALFFLISPLKNPSRHLRILARIANLVEQKDFSTKWLNAKNTEQLKQILLGKENFLSLKINSNTKTKYFINKKIKDLKLPGDTLLTMVIRDKKLLIPKGNTELKEGDKITVIGAEESIIKIKEGKFEHT